MSDHFPLGRQRSILPGTIELSNLTLAYQGHPAVHHLSGQFLPGSLTALIGPNGAGKSTLLSALSGQIRPAEGSIRIGNQRSDICTAYLPQQSSIDREFPVRVMDVVLLGAWRTLRSFSAVSKDLYQQAIMALETVGLASFERRFIQELSVGQMQRVLFARLVMQDAPIILLDEPFNALDTRTAFDLLQIVLSWHRQGRTVIAVLHDMNMVSQHFSQALLLARECIAWGNSADVLTPENLECASNTAQHWNEYAPLCTRPGSQEKDL